MKDNKLRNITNLFEGAEIRSVWDGEKSIRIDENCMDSSNRYKMFREDGLVYKDWESKESE